MIGFKSLGIVSEVLGWLWEHKRAAAIAVVALALVAAGGAASWYVGDLRTENAKKDSENAELRAEIRVLRDRATSLEGIAAANVEAADLMRESAERYAAAQRQLSADFVELTAATQRTEQAVRAAISDRLDQEQAEAEQRAESEEWDSETASREALLRLYQQMTEPD
jgi:type IV secretory pathway VirB10-like protein